MKRNVQTIKITGYNDMANCEKGLANILERLCYLRTARKIGDIETVNTTQISKLNQFAIPYQVIN